jgi:outer membrane lipoprotein-sorting protein
MTIQKLAILLLSLGLFAGFLTGCGEKSASDQAEDAVEDAADAVEDAADNMEDALN